MFVEYSSLFNPQNSLEIKDIGQCAIEGVNDDGLYFYLIIVAVRGIATIATCGPVVPDVSELPNGYTSEIHKAKFDQNKLKGVVFNWLNGRKPGKSKPITSAKIICIEDALSQFRNIGEYFYEDMDLSSRIFEMIDEGDTSNE